MTAGAELQAAVVAAVGAVAGLSGVYDGAPARAAFPYLVIDCGSEASWDFRGRIGREVAIELSLWDDQSARLLDFEPAIEARMSQLGALNGWKIASLVFAGKKKVRSANGPWACSLSYRGRLLKLAEGEV